VLADIAGSFADDAVSTEANPGDTGPAIAAGITLLDRVRRFESDSAIAALADAVRRRDDDLAVEFLANGDDQLLLVPDRDGAELFDLHRALLEVRRRMVRLAADPSRRDAALGALSEMAVLCAHRTGPDGVREWAHEVETGLAVDIRAAGPEGEWYPGRPIMITRNDYDLELYNGDIGVVVRTSDGLRAAFERNGVRTFPLTRLGEHTTVHAMTIHKSQGSQFGEVVVVLPVEQSRLLTRQLLYTAVTRAESRVWVVGSEAVVRVAIRRTVQRAFGLGELPWGDG
jgi:exodeoxyribonuclease V alpha subunit